MIFDIDLRLQLVVRVVAKVGPQVVARVHLCGHLPTGQPSCLFFHKESMNVEVLVENFNLFEDYVLKAEVDWSDLFLDEADLFTK